MGAMQEVRALLASGASSGQVIAQGYAPGTVYKVQRQFRRQQGRDGAGHPVGLAQTAPVSPQAAKRIEELEAQVEQLDGMLEAMAEDGGELAETLAELADTQEKLARVEAALNQEQTARLAAERRAESIQRDLTNQIEGLRAKLQSTSTAQVTMSQTATWAQRQLDEEKAARVKAEQGWQAWYDKGTELERSNQALTQMVTKLEPLRVWVGHPCKVCHLPMGGTVSREDAAKALDTFGHAGCLKKDGPGLGSLALGAAAVLALAQIGKPK